MYAAMLSVAGRACLVVGGGAVALRKIDGLLQEGAQVTVVSPDTVAAIDELAASGRIRLERRPYRPGEAGGYVLVLAATDRRDVNRQVAQDAEAAGRWVNVADDPELCTFHLPAQVRRGGLKLVVASGGEAPFAVMRIRRALERRFGAEWGVWLDAAARFRQRVRAVRLTVEEQESAYERFFSGTVDEVGLTVRVPTEPQMDGFVAEARRATAAQEPRSRAHADPAAAAAPGTASRMLVSLVGAGPGDPGLLTLRGRARLAEADAVVYDRLAAPALPTDLSSRVELHAVGKEAGHHPVPQEEINALLIRLARRNLRVVRLKGGDPYVFGRGSEEAEALHAAGIPFEVVPGITAGVAVPAYAGIPVTHRREAVRVTFLTAHESAKDGGSQVRWDLLARDPHATIVGYMGVTSLPEVCARLIGAGLAPGTPAALVARGTTSAQRIARATVQTLPSAAATAQLHPPALFVIGPTAGHAAHLDWFASRPLFGERIVVTANGDGLRAALAESGAEVVHVPVPVTEAARVVMAALPLTGAVLCSPTDVDTVEEERAGVGWGDDVVAWCIGPDTAVRARTRGWRRVEECTPDALVGAMAAREREGRREAR